ncbi:MAG TPA: DNA polymerase III subunit delta [Solirubrobacteraceae bacterium]|nr:DNA polymerase III subunit delta [Solirubrobacteraceae bacterium]
MPELKPAYLIHGDDHGAVAERRAGLRALAQAPGSEVTVELIEGEDASPAGAAAALSAMTLAVGRRVIVVEGVERWREGDVEQQLSPSMAAMPPDTTVALFAREEARTKAPAALHEAVRRAGGQVVAQMTVKPWELPKWAREQAARLGIALDAAAAKALVAQVGERQQRLLRELEKLALEGDAEGADPSAGPPGGNERRIVTVEDIERRAARSAEFRAFALADALVGADAREATLSYIRLREQGERLSGLIYLMASRLREALGVALRLQAGESEASVKRGLRMPARAATRFVADVARSDPARLRVALSVLADLELDSRGGAVIAAERDPFAALDEDTLAVRAIRQITA